MAARRIDNLMVSRLPEPPAVVGPESTCAASEGSPDDVQGPQPRLDHHRNELQDAVPPYQPITAGLLNTPGFASRAGVLLRREHALAQIIQDQRARDSAQPAESFFVQLCPDTRA